MTRVAKQQAVRSAADVPTPERLAQADGDVEPYKTAEGRTTVRFTDTDILEHMQARGVIDGDQYDCGKRWYRAAHKAGLTASGVIDPGRVVVDGGTDTPAALAVLEAAQEWAKAIQAIGRVHAHPLTDMVLFEMSPSQYGMRHSGLRDRKAARLVAYTLLKSALDALVLHYLGERRLRSSYHRGEQVANRSDLREPT